jgi:hypothetical protein
MDQGTTWTAFEVFLRTWSTESCSRTGLDCKVASGLVCRVVQRGDVTGFKDIWATACSQFKSDDKQEGCRLYHTAMMVHFEVPSLCSEQSLITSAPRHISVNH